MKRQLTGICMLPVWLLLSWPVLLYPQSIRKSVGLTGRETDAVMRNDRATERTETERRKEVRSRSLYGNDTIYSTQTKKQYGWILPLDTISKEDASHRSLSYRFTHRYPSGNWGKMETIDAYGNFASSYLSPYILKLGSADTDTTANAEWIEKLKTNCIYEFVPDPSGKNVIQERVYDKDGNIVYTYSRVPIGDGQYIGSYKDCYGLPAEMRKDSLFTYGTLVRLTEDRWGNDSIVEYIDAKGRRKPNSDGVAMEAFAYDRYGHVVQQQSRDGDGNLTIDNWNNCGVEYEWNADHQNVSAMYMDDKWQPMRMPDSRNVDSKKNVIKIRFKYDRYGRNTEEAYYTADDVPDTNAYGVHRTVCTFDDRGNMTEVVNYDKNGEPTGNSTGTAFVMHEYDDAGRTIRSVYLEKDRKPCSTEGYLSGVVYRYDEEGNRILYEEYSVVDGKEIKSYMEETGKGYSFVRWEDGSTRIDSLDARGRITLRAYYDKDGNPDKSKEFAFNRIEYIERPNRYRYTDSYYDGNGRLCNPFGDYAVEKIVQDTLSESVRSFVRMYDEQGALIKSYIWRYDKNGNVLSEDDANAYGVTCRAGGDPSIRYYRGKVMYSTSGEQLSSFIGRDEFGEPDYVYFRTGIYYYTKLLYQGGAKHYDENNQPITDQGLFKDACPKLMTIEVTDSAAYRLGLRDNDLVLIDGGYAADVLSLGITEISVDDLIRSWTLHSVVDAGRNRSMVVFRVDPETLEYGLVKIDGLKGSPSDLGYLAHIRYLTWKQVERIQGCVLENMESDAPLVKERDFDGKDYSGSNCLILAYTDMYRSERTLPYGRLVTDPAVLVASCMKDGDMVWRMGEDSSVFKNMHSMFRSNVSEYPDLHFFLTRNGRDVVDWECTENSVNTRWLKVMVSDEVYEQLLPLLKRTEPAISREMTDVPRIEADGFVGTWEFRSGAAGDSLDVRMVLLKDGTLEGHVEKYASFIYDDETSVIVRYRQDLDGEWRISGKFLEWRLSGKLQPELEYISMVGGDSSKEAEIWSVVKNMIKNDPAYFTGRMNVGNLDNLFLVKSLSDETLVVEGPTVIYTLSRLVAKEKKKGNALEETPASAGTVKLVNDTDSRRLVGQWWTTIPELLLSSCVLSLKENGEMEVDMKGDTSWDNGDSTTVFVHLNYRLGGHWEYYDGYLNITFDYTTLEPYVSFDVKGFEDEKAAERYKSGLYRNINHVEMAGSMIGEVSDFKAQKVEDITDDGFTFGGVRFMNVEASGRNFEDLAADKAVVIGNVEVPDGMLAKDGYTGNYIVLRWCDWDYTMPVNGFFEEQEKKKDKKKHIVLLPVEYWGNPNRYGEVLDLRYPAGMLGIRLSSHHIPYKDYVNELKEAYGKCR